MTRQPGRPASARRLSPRLHRDRQINRLLLLGGGLLIFLVIAIPGVAYYQDIVARGRSTALLVAGQTFTLNDFVDRLAFSQRLMNAQFAGVNDPQLQQFITQQRTALPGQVKNEMIESVLVRQEAERRGLTVSPEEVDQRIQDEFGGVPPTPQPAASPSPSPAPSPEASPTPNPTEVATRYQNFLGIGGLSDEQFRALVQSDLLKEKLTDALRQEVPQTAEQVKIRAIVLPTQDEAQQVLDQVQGGADFAALAAEKSIDQRTKTQGGEYDWMARGEREPAFEDKVFGAEPGLIPEVVPGLGGFAVVEVQEKDPARPLSTEQKETFGRQAYSRWLEAAKQQASIQDNLTGENEQWALARAERQSRTTR